jgi:hypothetical protein
LTGLGEKLVITGETIPNGNIEARIISKKNNFMMRQEFQSASGRFTFEESGLKKGTVFISFKVSDARGAESQWSRPVEIKIRGNFPLNFDAIFSSLGLEIIIGIFILIIIVIILITRALTIRKIRREMGW